jgi:hypothetical protein
MLKIDRAIVVNPKDPKLKDSSFGSLHIRTTSAMFSNTLLGNRKIFS